jgi:hypothetical protein
MNRLEAYANNAANEARSGELRKPVMAEMRYSTEHLLARETQIAALADETSALSLGIRGVRAGAGKPLWVTDEERSTTLTRADDAVRTLGEVRGRFEALIDTVRALPRRDR